MNSARHTSRKKKKKKHRKRNALNAIPKRHHSVVDEMKFRIFRFIYDTSFKSIEPHHRSVSEMTNPLSWSVFIFLFIGIIFSIKSFNFQPIFNIAFLICLTPSKSRLEEYSNPGSHISLSFGWIIIILIHSNIDYWIDVHIKEPD